MVSNLYPLTELKPYYETVIIGGGLAGLSAAIILARNGRQVALFEKESYPFHKVCGEYISMESWNFLSSLGIDLQKENPPCINRLLLTAPNGNFVTTPLPLGGFGMSRYRLDQQLAAIARSEGVDLFENTVIEQVSFEEDAFIVQLRGGRQTRALACCGAYGKRSRLDISLNREFLKSQDKRLDNYVGIKYHIQTSWPEHLIGLHNFSDGYCGISAIEENKYCLCYLTHVRNLKKCANNISQLEEEVLFENPHLRKIFTECRFCEGFPVSISQVGFSSKTQVENHILMLGDSAGMITPLCGNGMSIALHTGALAAGLVMDFLNKQTSRKDMEEKYAGAWKENFSRRLRTGRWLQSFFGSPRLSNVLVGTVKAFPFLAGPLVKMTHGKPF
jgi:flavin-dependent dehydrogenase